MLGGVLQRGAGGACEEEEEDPDAAAEEDGRLQHLQGPAGGDPHAADDRVQGDGETSATGGRTFHRGGRCRRYQQLYLSGHLLQVDLYVISKVVDWDMNARAMSGDNDQHDDYFILLQARAGHPLCAGH